MKALVYEGERSIALKQVDRPRTAAGEVLLRVLATGICGSDVHGYLGLTGRRIPPMIMGHEFCGTVEELGEGVDRVAVGDRVVVQPVVFCGRCELCRQGLTNLCPERHFFGVMSCNGSMAEYLNVPARLLYRMPDGMEPSIGAMIEPLSVAYRAVERAGAGIGGSTVLVVGAGTIGLLVLALVKLKGPRAVLVSDLSDWRLELARTLGADATFNPSRQDVVKAIREQTGGRGVDVSLEAVGVAASVEQALAALRPRGTCVWVGNSQRNVTLDMQRCVTRELGIQGSYVYTHAQFGQALDLLAREEIDVRPIISRTATLEQGPELFAALADPAVPLVKVVLEG